MPRPPLAAGLLLLALAAGCRHGRETCGPPPCPPPCETAASPRCESPPHVEVTPPPTVTVKVPPPQVIVQQQQLPPPPPPAPPPQPQPVAPPVAQLAGYVPAYQQLAVPTARARIAVAMDHIRLPFPRLFAVQVPEPQPVPFAPLAFAPQPVLAGYAPQPVYGVQPFSAVAPPAAVAVPVPAAVAAAPVTLPQPMPAAQAPPPRAATSSAVDDYCKQADALIRALEASKAALGCPPR